MSSRIEEQTSMNPAIIDKEESEISVGKANSDVKIQSIILEIFHRHSSNNDRNNTSPSIHKIPRRIRYLNPKVFEPRQVSIGPLHRQKLNLQRFEAQKEIFLYDLLVHSDIPATQIVETCVQKVNASIRKIKECYDDEIFKLYKDDDITKMMVMDGCFILEFIYKLFEGSFDENMVIEPISMKYDLVLMENQIPFFVLEDIFECTSSRFKRVTSLHGLIIHGLVSALTLFDLKIKIKKDKVFNKTGHILGFIHECYMRPSSDAEIKPSSKSDKSHILGFIHEWYRPLCDAVKKVVENLQSPSKNVEKKQSSEYENFEINLSDPEKFYSAVELDRAGVNFKPHHQLQDGKWSMDIELKFPRFSWCRPWAKPALRMPVLHIHSYTELVFRNLIAYEQLSPTSVLHYFTSYAIAMDRLIDNHEDVARLVKSEVLINTIGSNEKAAKLINEMCNEICCPHRFYIKEWEDLNKYHNLFWPTNMAWFRRTYCSNPWKMIALLAGMFLFVFTVVQTYYTINPV